MIELFLLSKNNNINHGINGCGPVTNRNDSIKKLVFHVLSLSLYYNTSRAVRKTNGEKRNFNSFKK